MDIRGIDHAMIFKLTLFFYLFFIIIFLETTITNVRINIREMLVCSWDSPSVLSGGGASKIILNYFPY
jgi:hypothetical protein